MWDTYLHTKNAKESLFVYVQSEVLSTFLQD